MEEKYKEVGESGPLKDPSGNPLSYEDLKTACLQMSGQLDSLSKVMNRTQQEDFYKKLDYNMMVLGPTYSKVFDTEFINKIKAETQAMLMPTNEEK